MKKVFRIHLAIFSTVVCLALIVWSGGDLIDAINKLGTSRLHAQANEDRDGLGNGDERPPVNGAVQANDYERIQRQVIRLGQTKNLKGLEELENATNASQIRNDIVLYTEVMIKICGGYNTYDFKDSRQYLLSRECAKNALERLNEMPIGRATNLVAQLGGDHEYLLKLVPESSWSLDRTQRAKYWFRAWQLLNDAITENYEVGSNRPIYHSKMTVGERANAEEYNRQRFLQRDRENFLTEFRRFVRDAYSRPPYASSELNTYLLKYVSDDKLRQEIMSEIQQKLSLAAMPK